MNNETDSKTPDVGVGSGAWFGNVWASCGHRLRRDEGKHKDGWGWDTITASRGKAGGNSGAY